MEINQNWGVLERWLAITWARLRSEVYCMFHIPCRIYIENTWVEDRGNKDIHGQNIWKEKILFIGVVKGSIFKNSIKVVKKYYGSPTCDIEAMWTTGADDADAPKK